MLLLHQASLDPDRVLEAAAAVLLGLGAESVSLFLVEHDQLVLRHEKDASGQPLAFPLHQGPLWRVASARTMLAGAELAEEERLALPEGLRTAWQLPLVSEDRLLGVALLQGCNARAEWLRLAASHIASALQNAALYEAANRQAITDGLTGLYNHRYFQDVLTRLAHSFRRYQRPFSLLMMDVDFFKAINDSYGHPVGDEILKHLARTLKKTLRATDIISRYGGDEVAVLLPETPLERGHLVAQRLVGIIQDSPFAGEINLSVSVGLAACPEHGGGAEEL
ncbi:MAG: sensor domain-containing diguanylate cyclase, partial [Bacteroidota bacterium]